MNEDRTRRTIRTLLVLLATASPAFAAPAAAAAPAARAAQTTAEAPAAPAPAAPAVPAQVPAAPAPAAPEELQHPAALEAPAADTDNPPPGGPETTAQKTTAKKTTALETTPLETTPLETAALETGELQTGGLETTLGRIGLAVPGQQLTLLGTGFRPSSTVEATLDPQTPAPTALGGGVADATGLVSLTVTLPASLPTAPHEIVMTGVDPAGSPLSKALAVTTPPTALTSSAPGPQSVTLPIPEGGWVTLLDDKEEPVTQVTSRDQGSYSLDPASGRITFRPDRMFWGPVRPVHYRLVDAVDQRVRGTYAPTVLARPLPMVRAAERTLTDADGATATIGCTAGPIAVARCEVTLSAVVGSEYVVLGTGTVAPANPLVGTRVADVALTPQGRRLAGRPGGIAAEIAARMWVPDTTEPVEATGTTQLTAMTVTAPRAIRYPAGGLDVPESELPYLNALRSRMADVTTVTCTGGTDDSGDADANRQIAEDRARRVCEYLTANTTARPSVRSVGEDQPVADNTTEEGRNRNRRVEITFSYATESTG
ncbi:OmpA family protein [Cryptosporangium minutisporangium]|uniref:OmpA-like domain-containing protein n=1 Tax=Cryptosporangium minutisporangium TaxID=113569 RepID=A0ABP6TDJ8_9ACTN